ncbi:fasciclin-like arabinogalactan protein 21 [Salvia hispanica]|uniref:fasciclin-like arabinogalactan protein 21 n=1 Tax=Salvia hispanica TaxID=49212 RepID=UPI0020090AEA|nr:fasciclin-like arabinogalactan protein 21 [Salvia hispanica]
MAAAESSCSHWWHAPFYVAMCCTLALMAISTARYPSTNHHALALNASLALRLQGGFHITATLLQISPELFLSSPHTTLFAIQDSAMSLLALPPSSMRHLLRYHAVPATLPMSLLLKKPPGFCLQTLAARDTLAITNSTNRTSLTINHVLVSHPDIFLHGPLAVHGVSAPFHSSSSRKGAVEWKRIIRVLSSNGFVSFAIGLNAVVDGILRDYANLSSVTVLAAPDFEFLSSPSPFLDRIVRLHILPHRFTYVELSALGMNNSTLTTLLPASHLHISPNLALNGLHITRPDIFSSNNAVLHGISRTFHFHDFFH